MGSITQELNHQRKAHRITIPIVISIDTVNYNVMDWSTIGIRVKDIDNKLSDTFNVGQEIDAVLILPTGKSSILLDLRIILKNKKILGFEITEMEEKNRRVLRHYATLAIEGNGQRIEDLMSDLLMMNVQTPIKEPIALTEEESKEVHSSFIKKAIIYILAGVVFSTILVASVIYNYVVIYHDPGLTTGNSESYMASRKGKLTDVYVEKGTEVFPGMLLYQINSDDEQYDLAVESERILSLNRKLSINNKSLKEYKEQYGKENIIKKMEILISKDELQFENKIYERAKVLFDKRLITAAHYNDATQKYLLFKQSYENNKKEDKKESVDTMSYKDTIAEYENIGYDIQKSINRSNIKVKNIKRKIKDHNAIANQKGIVHSMKYKINEYVDYADRILMIETDEKPYVLTKMMPYDAVDVFIGQECVIYSKKYSKKYKGIISGIGYSTTDTQTKMTTEVSENEIPIRIDFLNSDVRFHLNQRMNIWILRDSDFLKYYYDLLLWN